MLVMLLRILDAGCFLGHHDAQILDAGLNALPGVQGPGHKDPWIFDAGCSSWILRCSDTLCCSINPLISPVGRVFAPVCPLYTEIVLY